MGLRDWFSKSEEEEEDTLRRYLVTPNKDYSDMDEFLGDFNEMINTAVEKYSEANQVRMDKFDKDKAYKSGSRWIYQADVQKLDEAGKAVEQARGGFLSQTSSFKIIARQQPEFAIELSGTNSLIEPFTEELETVLGERGEDYDLATIAEPGLGKAKDSEVESEPT